MDYSLILIVPEKSVPGKCRAADLLYKCCGFCYTVPQTGTRRAKEGFTMLFVCYPKCTTCQKARKWLDEAQVSYTERDIKTDRPTEDELRAWHAASGLPLKKFFNTSGLVYKSLELSKKLPSMSEDEQYALLATDGMLVKRPILVGDGFVLVGFREADWAAALGK